MFDVMPLPSQEWILKLKEAALLLQLYSRSSQTSSLQGALHLFLAKILAKKIPQRILKFFYFFSYFEVSFSAGKEKEERRTTGGTIISNQIVLLSEYVF